MAEGMIEKRTGDREPGGVATELLIEDDKALGQLGAMIFRLTSNLALRDDLMQEAMIHLWQIQQEQPGQTRNWYLQNCRFHLLHYLSAGRSVDSPKRRNSQVQPESEDAPDEFMAPLASHDHVLEDVSARDILLLLTERLSEREQIVLRFLVDGLGPREIAKRLKLSHPMIIKHRRKIAALAVRLEFKPGNETRFGNS
jgi:RNA polymerase sigma factor (sigma-70 family)